MKNALICENCGDYMMITEMIEKGEDPVYTKICDSCGVEKPLPRSERPGYLDR